MSDLVQRLRFLASGQDDIHSMAITEAADELELLTRELEAARKDRRFVFAGWFASIPSAMSFLLWEQGGAEQRPGDVALYVEAAMSQEK